MYLSMCTLLFMLFTNFFRTIFPGITILVLILPVPGHNLLSTFLVLYIDFLFYLLYSALVCDPRHFSGYRADGLQHTKEDICCSEPLLDPSGP